MKNKIARILGALLSIVALVAASSASSLVFYQPKVPKCVKK